MLADIRAAFSFLTILPLGSSDASQPGRSFAWFPLVGLCIGIVLSMVASAAPFDRDLSAFLLLLLWVLITGGLHLDGFGDSCDGLLASVGPDQRRQIMKDPRAGIWAVAGLILLLLGKWLAIRALSPDLMILPPVLGRWAMVWAAHHFPFGGGDGLGAYFRGGLGGRQVLIASAIVFIIGAQTNTLILWLLTFGFTYMVGRWASRRLGGGISGDVYGAICELSELLCLLALGVIYG